MGAQRRSPRVSGIPAPGGRSKSLDLQPCFPGPPLRAREGCDVKLHGKSQGFKEAPKSREGDVWFFFMSSCSPSPQGQPGDSPRTTNQAHKSTAAISSIPGSPGAARGVTNPGRLQVPAGNSRASAPAGPLGWEIRPQAQEPVRGKMAAPGAEAEVKQG